MNGAVALGVPLAVLVARGGRGRAGTARSAAGSRVLVEGVVAAVRAPGAVRDRLPVRERPRHRQADDVLLRVPDRLAARRGHGHVDRARLVGAALAGRADARRAPPGTSSLRRGSRSRSSRPRPACSRSRASRSRGAALGSSYGGGTGTELGRLVAYLAPWMVVSVALSVAFPLLFVRGRARWLPLLAVGRSRRPRRWSSGRARSLFGLAGIVVGTGGHDGGRARRAPRRARRARARPRAAGVAAVVVRRPGARRLRHRRRSSPDASPAAAARARALRRARSPLWRPAGLVTAWGYLRRLRLRRVVSAVVLYLESPRRHARLPALARGRPIAGAAGDRGRQRLDRRDRRGGQRASFPSVELIVNPANLGFAGGNNAGIRRALGSRRRPRARPEQRHRGRPGVPRPLLEEAARRPDAGALSPEDPLRRPARPDLVRRRRATTRGRATTGASAATASATTGAWTRSVETDRVCGAAMLVPREGARARSALFDPAALRLQRGHRLVAAGPRRGLPPLRRPGEPGLAQGLGRLGRRELADRALLRPAERARRRGAARAARRVRAPGGGGSSCSAPTLAQAARAARRRECLAATWQGWRDFRASRLGRRMAP